MNNTPTNQTMNRLVLGALRTLQCGSFEAILKEVAPFKRRSQAHSSFERSLKNSLNQLKHVGLLRVSCNSEYILYKCLEKPLPDTDLKRTSRTTKMKSTKSKTAQKKKQTEMLGRALRSAGVIAKKNNNNIGVGRSSLLSFLTSCADLRAGRTVSSMVQPSTQDVVQNRIEPMESEHAPTASIAVAKPTGNKVWQFVPPIPLE